MTNDKLKNLIFEAIKEIILLEKKKNVEKKVGRPRSEDADPVIARVIDRMGGSEEFADEIGLSQSQVNKIARGDSSTSALNAVKIQKITSGMVDPARIVKNAEE